MLIIKLLGARNIKYSIFNISFLILMFMPTFGSALGGILINLISFFLSVFYIFIISKKQTAIIKLNSVALVFFILSLLLMISFFQDIFNGMFDFGSFFSALRPFFIFATIYASYLYWNTNVDLISTWNSFLDTIFASLFFCVFIEFIFPKSSLIFNFLYGARSSDLSGPLGTSYYIGYIFFLMYLNFLFKLKSKFNLINLLKLVIAFVIIFLCESKPPLLIAIFMFPFLFFPIKSFKIFTLIYFGFLIILFSNVKTDELTEILVGFNIDSYNVKSLIRILDNAEGAGTYSVRQEQAEMAISGSFRNYGFGLGLGRDILLESWLSYYGYRYGVIGLVIYFVFWVYLGISSYLKGLKNNRFNENWYILVVLGFWFFFQAALLMSGGMNESGITGIFNSIIIGLIIVLLEKKGIYPRKKLNTL